MNNTALMQEYETKYTQKGLNKHKEISYQKLFWLFMLGSILGFVLEGVWCIFTKGGWQHHSATVWGPFCIVYGIGAVAVCLISYFVKSKNIAFQLIVFFVAGAGVEYFSSFIQELCFGSTSWNYSGHFLNLGGRVSLKMALIWAVLGVLFMKAIFPFFNRCFKKIYCKVSCVVCIALTVFMVINLLVTSAAIIRWKDRQNEIPASNSVLQLLDIKYSNETMERLFPNMIF